MRFIIRAVTVAVCLSSLGARSATSPIAGPVLSMGNVTACVVLADRTVACWGSDDGGQLGTGQRDDVGHVPVKLTGLSNVATVGVGRYFACALTLAGTVSCWGTNSRGWLGDGTRTDHYLPAPVKLSATAAFSGAVRLSVGTNHACGINSIGDVYCWGTNSSGQLGEGTGADRLFATRAGSTGLGFVEVAAGDEHTCALRANGEVWCWGLNGFGQVGDGTTATRLSPVKSLVPNARAVAAGAWHSCATLLDGTVKCWGQNTYGQAGNADAYGNPLYTCGQTGPNLCPVPGLKNVTGLSAGSGFTCAVHDDLASCWGRDDRNQLGGDPVVRSPFVVRVGRPTLGAKALSVAAGMLSTCAVASGGSVRCWGLNLIGEVGDGTAGGKRRPFTAAAPYTVVLPGIGKALE